MASDGRSLARSIGAASQQRQRITAAVVRERAALETRNAPAKRNATPVFTGGFAGARLGRSTADWVDAAMRSAQQDIRADFLRLRARGRELVRNSPDAKRYVHLVAENVIGDTGIRYRPTVQKSAGVFDREMNLYLREQWEEWCEPDNCTVDGRSSFLGLTHEIMRTMPMDGEAVIRMVRGFDNPWGFALQWIDADQIDHNFNREPSISGDGAIRQGVELNRWGRPVAHWMWQGHPSEPSRGERVRVPADEIRHLFVPIRRSATRGVTWFHPVMLTMRVLAGYTEAELTAARVAACQMGFFQRTGEAGAEDPDTEEGQREKLTLEAEAGLLMELDPDLTFNQWDPKHPTQAFPMFVKTNQRSIATGLLVSYNTLFNDLEGVNYSSIRSGTLSERDAWRVLQGWLATQFHSPVHREWMRFGTLSGKLRLKASDEVRLRRAQWRPRGFPWIDPLNDVQAFAQEVPMGINSRSIAAGERGRDFEDVVADLAHEQEIAAEYKITLASGPVKTTITDKGTNTPGEAPATAASSSTDTTEGDDGTENQ